MLTRAPSLVAGVRLNRKKLRKEPGRKRAPSDQHLDAAWRIGPVEAFDRLAVEIKTHRAVRRIIDDETGRGAMKRNGGR